MWLIIDGNNLLNRILKSGQGDSRHSGAMAQLDNGGLYGALQSIEKLSKQFPYSKIILVWDGTRSQRRLDIYPAYKANRGKTKSEQDYLEYMQFKTLFLEQKKVINETLCQLPKVYILSPNTWEADDIIALLVTDIYPVLEDPQQLPIIASSDKDFLQLVGHCQVFRQLPNKKEFHVTIANFLKFYPYQFPKNYLYHLAITGDKNDDIAGVNGVGDKTATQIIQEYEAQDLPFLEYIASLKEHKTKRYRDCAEQIDTIERNIQLISLFNLSLPPILRTTLINYLRQPQPGDPLQFIKALKGFSEKNKERFLSLTT